MNNTPEFIADEIITLFKNYGQNDYIGEKITQTEHMVQAAMIAEQRYNDPTMILAALLHDIGHLLAFESDEPVDDMEGYGIVDHEYIAADYLRKKGFSEEIAKLIENHVSAKRYLCSVDPTYYNNLSDASKFTFHQQGSYLTDEEIAEYKTDPLYKKYCQLRNIDDEAKKENYPIKQIDSYYPLLVKHISLQMNGGH